MTFTRTHVYITFADPYLACEQCDQPVQSYHDEHDCGCDAGWWNQPCGHRAGVKSTCPSWGPVDGCTCADVLGHVPHDPAPEGGQP